jgi:hypothetical protein
MTEPASRPAVPADALPRSLLRQLRADPGHLPELLALFAVRHTGRGAARRTARLREQRPQASTAELRHRVGERGERTVLAEGAFVGGPVMLLVPVAFCAALLAQARTVLELAALSGRDPTAQDRAADLLVLQGVYPDTDRAAEALTTTGRSLLGGDRPARREGRRASLWHLTVRMARLLGVVTPGTGRKRRWYVQAALYLLTGLVLVVGVVAPLVWVPFMVVSYRSSTRRLLERANAYYFGHGFRTAPPRSGLDAGLLLAALRAGLSLLLPIALTVGLLGADLRLAGSRWAAAGIALAALSLLTGVVWLVHRFRRGDDDASGP